MFRETVDFLAAGIASALNLLNSELVLLGGDGLCWTDRHVADLESAIARPAPSGWGRQSPGEKAALPGGGSASGGGLRRDRPDLLGGATSSKRVISRGGLPQYRKSHKKYIFLL